MPKFISDSHYYSLISRDNVMKRGEGYLSFAEDARSERSARKDVLGNILICCISVTLVPICLLEVIREHPQKSWAPEAKQAPILGGPRDKHKKVTKKVLVCWCKENPDVMNMVVSLFVFKALKKANGDEKIRQ
jgi:hypothetical protein